MRASCLAVQSVARHRRARVAHGAELQDLERGAVRARHAAGGRRAAHGSRRGRRRRTNGVDDRRATSSPAERERDVEQTLHARVARRVDLADVEQQRHPLELADRQLAEPLLVEQRRASGSARRRSCSIDACATMSSSACAARLSTTTGRPASAARARAVDASGGMLVDVGLAGRQRRRRRWPGAPATRRARLVQDRDLVGARRPRRTRSRSVARGPAVTGEGRAEDVPGHQDDARSRARRTAGGRASPTNELHERTTASGGDAAAHAPTQERAAAGAGLLRQSERVRGQAQQQHVAQRPGEPGRSRPRVLVRDRVRLAQPDDGDRRPGVERQAPEAAHAQFIDGRCR